MRRHIFMIAAALAISGGIYAGWYWGDSTHAPKIEAVVNAVRIG